MTIGLPQGVHRRTIVPCVVVQEVDDVDNDVEGVPVYHYLHHILGPGVVVIQHLQHLPHSRRLKLILKQKLGRQGMIGLDRMRL